MKDFTKNESLTKEFKKIFGDKAVLNVFTDGKSNKAVIEFYNNKKVIVDDYKKIKEYV